MTTTGPLLIGYDGSPDARAAIKYAAHLLPGATAVVLYARQPLESVAAHLEGHPALEDLRDLDTATLDASERLAAEGADLAQQAGLDAKPRVATAMGTAAKAIVHAADDVNASLIVLGSRGRHGLQAALLGSTSTIVLHHTHRPTLVIPTDHTAASTARAHPPAASLPRRFAHQSASTNHQPLSRHWAGDRPAEGLVDRSP